jgi:hypothetical protein
MNTPKEGSKWTSSSNVSVVVLHTIDLDDHIWVHYRKESGDQAYSCYVESFLERFTPVL